MFIYIYIQRERNEVDKIGLAEERARQERVINMIQSKNPCLQRIFIVKSCVAHKTFIEGVKQQQSNKQKCPKNE